MDILKQIFSSEAPATTVKEKKEDKMVVETTFTKENVRPEVVKEGTVYTKEVQCQPQKEIERIREIEIGTQSQLSAVGGTTFLLTGTQLVRYRHHREGASRGARRP
jgi:hypothetical protein